MLHFPAISDFLFQLRNVIVETADVASKLFARGRLTQRLVCLPLDKMNARTISDQVLRTAQSLVQNKNQVQRAIDLIEYDNHLHPAMAHIFGNILVCSDLNVAKKVAYHNGVKCLCVTLDGDKVNPTGEMSGGAAIKTGSVLAHVNEVMEAKRQLQDKERCFTKLESDEERLRHVAEQFNNLKLQHDTKVRKSFFDFFLKIKNSANLHPHFF